ncbi:MAG: glucose-1-phosphate thymidylyltransferase [Candidatus Margulisiibacteriota bacterium]
MKALILSGGAGTRLRPLTHTSAKQLLPVANKPIIFYGIEAIAAAGVKDFAIIVGDTAEDVMREVGDGSRWGVNISYIKQEAPLGLAHAVKISRDFIKDDSFIMFLGDNLLKEGIPEFVSKFNKNKPNALILLTKVPNPEQFGVAELDASGKVKKLVEKPKNPKTDLALVGIYLFDRNIFKAVDAITPSRRGELEITDAIQWLVDNGYKVEPHMVSGWWKDTGKPEDLIEANRLVLGMIQSSIAGVVDGRSSMSGKVVLGKGSEVVSSTIKGPVTIGDNCKISGSTIGPFVSIGHNGSVLNCRIENSIIMEDCSVSGVKKKISASILGKGVKITGASGSHGFVVGDRSEISLV